METGVKTDDDLIRELSLPLYECRGWMKLAGVMSIIMGALQAITIIGILWAWLPIWIGIIIFQAASLVESARLSGRKDEMLRSLDKLKTYFMIWGIMILVAIILMFILVFFVGVGAIISSRQ